MSKEITPAQAIKQDLARMGDQFKAALPNHIPVEKFVRSVQTAVATAPNLINANRLSLFAAAMKAAQDGLLPDGKEAAIVTFKNKQGQQIANYMPMVGGILKKVRNSGELSTITAQIIYEKDDFKFFIDETGEHLRHEPNMFGDRGQRIGCYASAVTKDGGTYIEVMTSDEVMAVKNVSRGSNGPWSGPFETEMWKKTVIKRLAKRLPMSTDLEFTIRADDDLCDLNSTEAPVKKEKSFAENSSTTPNRLKDLVAEATKEVEKEQEEAISEGEIPI